ncbi:uncharacterized protein PODANS_6_11540, partial [Podospora anserina S mat+]
TSFDNRHASDCLPHFEREAHNLQLPLLEVILGAVVVHGCWWLVVGICRVTHTMASATWQPVEIRDTILHLIARISSRVFLGSELCRNEDWLKVTRDYTADAMRAAIELRFVPKPVRFLAHWFMPSCQKARVHVQEARRIIGPVLEKRRVQKMAGNGNFDDDAIEWYVLRLFEREAQGKPYDPVIAQLVMSMAAIHTTRSFI